NDPDNNPDAARMVGCAGESGTETGGKLLVLLQDLDRTAGYVPVDAGRLALIDLANPSDVSIIQLAGQNPTAITVLPGCKQAIIGSAGDQLGGNLAGLSGVEIVDLVAKQTGGLVVTDKDFMGNVTTLDAADSRDVFVAISQKSGSTYNNNIFVL